ncbi:hypothetical protein N1851_019242 [Merluccius polli]|uniref:Uncharacterized protein n=1 Tax=Merluccius polli TaxID=89951 RepID=A0AA47NZT7_MERPO|nr:hypothetical protein N1851_019242 [Merluccius polli]
MDHVYLKTTCNRLFSSETTYRLTPTEIEAMVKLRMSNRAYFSGKRNASMRGWRAILKHMGLHTKMTFNQAAKKWDNMRKKYKELKYPPEGVQFSLGGAGASEIEVSLHNSAEEEEEEEEGGGEEEEDEVAGAVGEAAVRGDREAESRVDLQFALRDMDSERASMDSERASMEGERALMERERQLMAKESLALQRERVALEREAAALERDRATLERERTSIEREKVLMEREKAMLDRDRVELSRERLAMERGRDRLARCAAAGAARDSGVNNNNNNDNSSSRVEEDREVMEDSGENGVGLADPETLQRRERFLALFEKLVENF